jgi:hypothetical protein
MLQGLKLVSFLFFFLFAVKEEGKEGRRRAGKNNSKK